MSLTSYWSAAKLISIYRGMLTSKISAVGQPRTPKKFMQNGGHLTSVCSELSWEKPNAFMFTLYSYVLNQINAIVYRS
jgi:hypothetical protein